MNNILIIWFFCLGYYRFEISITKCHFDKQLRRKLSKDPARKLVCVAFIDRSCWSEGEIIYFKYFQFLITWHLRLLLKTYISLLYMELLIQFIDKTVHMRCVRILLHIILILKISYDLIYLLVNSIFNCQAVVQLNKMWSHKQ